MAGFDFTVERVVSLEHFYYPLISKVFSNLAHEKISYIVEWMKTLEFTYLCVVQLEFRQLFCVEASAVLAKRTFSPRKVFLSFMFNNNCESE